MDLRHLRYFVCVAEEMHFGRAAQRLGISQPPLSQQIRALEEELGVRLFDRTSRRVRLTEAGSLFLPEARQTLFQAERAAQTARLAQSGDLGRLRLGFIASAPFVPEIAGALYNFRQSHPHVHLALQELDLNAQIEQVAQGQLDIGIVRTFDPPSVQDCTVAECMLEEDMVVAVRADHLLAAHTDIAIADLAGVPLVLYGATNGAGFNEHFFALCERAGFRPTVAFEVGSFATLLGLVAAGFGATILAQSLARLQIENVSLRRFSSPVTSRLWTVHKHALPPTAAIFKRTLSDACKV